MLRRPLTKRLPGGMLNQRPSEIEAALAQVLDLNRDQVIEALSIRDRTHTKYIPPRMPCVDLLRTTRWDNRETYFEHLYKALMDRIDRTLPRSEHAMSAFLSSSPEPNGQKSPKTAIMMLR